MPQPFSRSPRYRWDTRLGTVVPDSAVTAPPAPSHIKTPHSLSSSNMTIYFNDNTFGLSPHYAFAKQSSDATWDVVGIIGKKEYARFKFSLQTTTPSTVSWDFGFASYNSQAISSILSVTL